MRILLVAGGYSNEREISIRSGKAVHRALEQLGHTVAEVDPPDKAFSLQPYINGIDAVFLALHGEGGEDGTLQHQLEDLGIPFVGSGSAASRLCWNKWNYKQLLLANGLPASRGAIVHEVFDDFSDEIMHPEFKEPFVLKPNRGGSSLDTLIARNATDNDREAAMSLLEQYPAGMLLEPLIEGAEITVGILGDIALPVVEIIPPDGKEFDYENKYNGSTRELCPPRNISEKVQRKAQDVALQIHNLTGCRHMSRTDMIVDKNEDLHVLETNTIPGLTDASLLPLMAKQAGYSMEQLIDGLLGFALQDTRVDQRA